MLTYSSSIQSSDHSPSGDSEVDLRHAMLDGSVKVEPLIDGWYAWPHLIAPVQQAFNLAFRYLPTANSFASAPAVHIAASSDPAMFGGPFLDLPASAVDAVKDYIRDTTVARAEALAFAETFRAFDRHLQESADGYSLDALREALPAALRGLVELAYDLNNHPRLRLLEEMLDAGAFGHDAAQAVLLHRQRDVDRPFFLSTPRLAVAGGETITAPFRSHAVKTLYAARSSSVDVVELSEALGAPLERLASYFVNTDARRTAEAYEGPGVRVRYFGHASLVIETRRSVIVVDPTAAHEQAADAPHFTLDDFPPRIDVLLISHGHQDHLCPEVLMHLRARVGMVLLPPNNRGELADPSLKRILVSLGYEESAVRTLDPLDRLELPDGAITTLPFSGEHCDLDVHSKQCAMVELDGRRICLFVDSDAIDLDVYLRLAPKLAEPDLLFVGMECFGAPLSWLYGPLISSSVAKKHDLSRRLSGANCNRAWKLVEALRPRAAYVYAMGQEPWLRPLMGLNYTADSIQLLESNEFVDRCRSAGIPAERLNGIREFAL